MIWTPCPQEKLLQSKNGYRDSVKDFQLHIDDTHNIEMNTVENNDVLYITLYSHKNPCWCKGRDKIATSIAD